MAGGRADTRERPRARAESVVVPFPRAEGSERLALVRFVPRGRTLLLAFGLLLGAVGSWIAARETNLFAVEQIAVSGAEGGIPGQVRGALRDSRGESLLALDLDAARRSVEALPSVARATFDRAYPHTLRVEIRPERPVAVVRQGSVAYLVSARGRVIAKVARGAHASLARIWAPRATQLSAGAFVTDELRTAVSAVAPIAAGAFPGRVTSVKVTPDTITLRLGSGLELRLGDPVDARLKLVVAARVLPLVRPGTTYLDVSVPERPVAGNGYSQPQVDVESSLSTKA